MPLSALSLVLFAALCHASWNIVAKQAGGDNRFALMTSVLVLIVWAPLGIWAGWPVVATWGLVEWSILIASALAHLVYFAVLLRGYRLSDLTIVYPIARGSAPLLSSLGAVWLLDELLTVGGIAGAMLITLGVFLIAGGTKIWSSARDETQKARVKAGLIYGAVTGGLIALYTLIDGYSVKVLLISPILIDYVGSFFRMVFLLPYAFNDPEAFHRCWKLQWKQALVVSILGPLGYVLVLFAAQIAPLSHVAPAREVSMLFAALVGGKLLRESDSGLRLVGALSIALGVVALAFG